MKKFIPTLILLLVFKLSISQVGLQDASLDTTGIVCCKVHGGNLDQTQSYIPQTGFSPSAIVTCPVIKETELIFEDKKASISVEKFPEGVYLLNVKSDAKVTVSRRFVIIR